MSRRRHSIEQKALERERREVALVGVWQSCARGTKEEGDEGEGEGRVREVGTGAHEMAQPNGAASAKVLYEVPSASRFRPMPPEAASSGMEAASATAGATGRAEGTAGAVATEGTAGAVVTELTSSGSGGCAHGERPAPWTGVS